MDKARNGEDVVIGVIGGSITQGYAASTESKRWANLVTNWWKVKFPLSNITLVNAGIGGTGSDIGTHRVQDDLLKYEPDFTIVEFSVNDSEGEHAEKMMEGLIRQILADTNYPGVMMLMLKQSNGTTAQASHKLVANHYKVPYVSFADLIDAAVAANGVSLESIFTDGLHPNDVGMAYIAEFINNELDSIYKYLPAGNQVADIDTVLPNPLVTDVFAHTYKYNSSNIIPVSNGGWSAVGTSWESETPGSEITFEVDGNAISILYNRHNYANGGRVEIWVDEGARTTLDAYWDQTWGPAIVFQLVAEGLADGVHILHIKVLAEHNPATTGNYFKVLNVLKAGNIGSAAPIAVAGTEKKKILTGNPVELDGSNSFDPDGDNIVSYTWSVDAAPASSSASVNAPGNAITGFSPDVEGYYTIGLVVNDGTLNSVKKNISIHAVADNAIPEANAGDDFTIATGKYATLDGNNSSDSDDDSLSYAWTLLSKPTGSRAGLVYETTPAPMAKLDKAGQYTFSLIVNDSLENSLPDTVVVTAIDGYTGINLADELEYKLNIYPNPAKNSVFVDYYLDKSSVVKINLFSADGKLLTDLVNNYQEQGNHHIEIDLKSLDLTQSLLLLNICFEETTIVKHIILQ
jgi:lysophospholipase L1-like esterase